MEFVTHDTEHHYCKFKELQVKTGNDKAIYDEHIDSDSACYIKRGER